jgi:hypothetical protein
VEAKLGGFVLGKAPLVVVAAPPPEEQGLEPVSGLPWWERGVETVNGAADDLFHAIFG